MTVFLDTNVAGDVTNPNPKSTQTLAVRTWANRMEQAGHLLIVPAIVDYELRRKHEHRGATASIAALDAFVAPATNRYLELTDSALKLAAHLWASLRQQGLPTADIRSLDCDVMLAAQVLDLGLPVGSFVVATENVAHLSRIIACDSWRNIVP